MTENPQSTMRVEEAQEDRERVALDGAKADDNILLKSLEPPQGKT